MDFNKALRRRVKRLVSLGFTQKKIGQRLSLKEYEVSRWLNNEDQEVGINAQRAWIAYLKDLIVECQQQLTEISEEVNRETHVTTPVVSEPEKQPPKDGDAPHLEQRRRLKARS